MTNNEYTAVNKMMEKYSTSFNVPMSQKETMIWANLRGSTFACAIQSGQVGEILKRVDACAEKEGITEQSAMDFIADVLEDSEREEEMLKRVVALLLWAACRCPTGKIAEEAARKGGKSVGFEIVHNSDGGLTYGLHVRDGFEPNVRSLLGVQAAGRA